MASTCPVCGRVKEDIPGPCICGSTSSAPGAVGRAGQVVRSTSRITVLVAAAFALSVPGCDPGYTYQPVGPQGNRLPLWSETVEGVRFSARPCMELVGSRSTSGQMEIANESDKEVVVLAAQLVTNGRTIEANIFDNPAHREARTVPPGGSKSVSLSWDFGGSASEVLGPDITWVWRVRIGTEEHSLRVSMKR